MTLMTLSLVASVVKTLCTGIVGGMLRYAQLVLSERDMKRYQPRKSGLLKMTSTKRHIDMMIFEGIAFPEHRAFLIEFYNNQKDRLPENELRQLASEMSMTKKLVESTPFLC